MAMVQGMRIAHFIQRYPPALGGSEAYFARLSRFLAAAGDQVTVFTTTALDLSAFWSRRGRCLSPGACIEDGVEVRRYQPSFRFPGRRYLLKPLSMLPWLSMKRMLMPCSPMPWRMWTDAAGLRCAFDIVHASAFPYSWPLACGLRLARRLRVPFALTPFMHMGDPEDPRDRTRREYTSQALISLARAADLVFVQTDAEYGAMRDAGVAPECLCLAGLGVDRQECTGGDRRRARSTWGVRIDETVVGHLANNSQEKGTVDLLLAANEAWRRGHRFVVVLAGPEMPNFARFWRTFEPRGQVVRLGMLDDVQKRDFFAGLDLFALPSRSDSFGLVLLEAWTNGVPNIVYRAGGPAEVVRHEIDGLIVRCGDVSALAGALVRLIGNPWLRHALGQAGCARIEPDFGWDDKLTAVRVAYQKAIGKEQPVARPSLLADEG